MVPATASIAGAIWSEYPAYNNAERYQSIPILSKLDCSASLGTVKKSRIATIIAMITFAQERNSSHV
jgi:hypothetical protein